MPVPMGEFDLLDKWLDRAFKRFLEEHDFAPKIAESLDKLSETVDQIKTQQGDNMRAIFEVLTAVQSKFDDAAAEIGGKLDANTAQAVKAFGEIRKALDDAIASKITQEELDAAVKAQESNDLSAMQTALSTLTDKFTAQSAALQKLDDIVPDAPPVPVPPAPVSV